MVGDISIIDQPFAAVDVNTISQTLSATWNGSGTPPANSVAMLVLDGQATACIQVVGAFTGTLITEISVDGVNFGPGGGLEICNASASSTRLLSLSNPGFFRYNVSGLRFIRVRVSALSSGTPTVSINGSAVPANVMVEQQPGLSTSDIPALDGVDGTGITAPTGGSGLRGWASGSYSALVSILAKLGTTLSASITNFPTSFNIGNFPTTQPVSGTVAVSNQPTTITATQASGANLHVDVDNFPSTQAVSGSVTATISGTPTVAISGAARSQTQAAYYASQGVLFGASTGIVAPSGLLASTPVNVFALYNPSGNTKSLYVARTDLVLTSAATLGSVVTLSRLRGFTTATGGTAATPTNQSGASTTSVATVKTYLSSSAITGAGTGVADRAIGTFSQAIDSNESQGAIVIPPGQAVIWQLATTAIISITPYASISATWWEV